MRNTDFRHFLYSNSPLKEFLKDKDELYIAVQYHIAETIHERLEKKYYSHSVIDGLQAFYYAMEELSVYEAPRTPMSVFALAQTEMQWAWDNYYNKMEEEKMLEEPVPNNYDVWTEDDLPW